MNNVSRSYSPYFDNLKGQGDRISCAANELLLDKVERNDLFIDHYYGHSWSFIPQLGAGLYGITQEFSPSPIDHLANGNFLRVPYRRVPVIDVTSAAELSKFATSIYSRDKSIKLRWRGQNKEYYLSRADDELLRLYGCTSVLEPSLVPSAARDKLEFSTVFPCWAAILDLFIRERRLTSVNQLRHKMANFHCGYNYRLWAFATAQHYGLPSVGLDITTDMGTALLFALHKFKFDKASGLMAVQRVDKSATPVLYAMGGFENDLFDDRDLAPPPLQGERPKAQNAHFFGTGWGSASNRAAERIFVAFRLQDHINWPLPKPVNQLFPGTDKDSLLEFLLRTRDRFPELANETHLNKIYYVKN